MAHVKVYALNEHLQEFKGRLSDAIRAAAVEALGLPAEKRFHRFIGLDPDDFCHPPDRSSRYTILEIHLFVGRSVDIKKQLIRSLFERCAREASVDPQDLEITLIETPRCNWGIRGVPGDELQLTYRVDV